MSRRQLGERLSQRQRRHVKHYRARIGGLFLTGGDIATAVASALGAEGYRIQSEVAPCIPCGTFVNSEIDDLPVITKAGGFGSEQYVIVTRFIILRRCIVETKTVYTITMGDPAGIGPEIVLKKR